MMELNVNRASRLVDPSLAIWGWEIPVYLFLGGVTAGVMIVSGVLARRGAESRSARWLALAAPVLLSFGMLALFLDLEQKLHVYRFYLVFRPTSPMSWGAWILMVVYPLSALFSLARLTSAEADRAAAALRGMGAAFRRLYAWSAARLQPLSLWMMVVGAALGAYTGVLIGTLGARAVWGSPLLAPLFLVSGLSTGAAFMMLFPLAHAEKELVRRTDVVVIVTELVLLALYFIGLVTTGGRAGAQAAALFFTGPFTTAFWTLVVIAGLAVPLAMSISESRRRLAPTRVIPLLVLLGGFSLRWILVAAGQA